MRLLKTYLQTQANGLDLCVYERPGLSGSEVEYANIKHGDE